MNDIDYDNDCHLCFSGQHLVMVVIYLSVETAHQSSDLIDSDDGFSLETALQVTLGMAATIVLMLEDLGIMGLGCSQNKDSVLL